MAFKQKTWTNRVAEFINRRLLTYEDGRTELVTVARSEGTVSVEGDGFNDDNMNDLEQRIADEFTAQNDNFTNKFNELNNALSEMKTYSTEERVVGTDCDGSPIYEKTYYSDNLKLTSSIMLDETINNSNVKRLIDIIEAYSIGSSWNGRTLYVNQADSLLSMYTRIMASGVQLVIGGFTVMAYHVTIRYVKA